MHYPKELGGRRAFAGNDRSRGAIYFTADFRVIAGKGFRERIRLSGKDILAMLRSAIPLLTLVLICSPIGAGGLIALQQINAGRVSVPHEILLCP